MPEIRTGVWFQGGLRVEETVELAKTAEAAGVDSVWMAEGLLARDAFITLSAVALATEQVQLGTGVVNPFSRHPAQLAASFASLDELSGGRAVCGVGVGARDYLVKLGFDVSKPLAIARETVEVLRVLLRREPLTLDGKKFQLEDARLGIKPPRSDIPVYLAAAGPKMCELAGEVADGAYIYYGSPTYLRGAVERTATKRPNDADFDVASPVMLAVDQDPAEARARVKPGIGLILTEPNAESVLEANGLDPALAQRIRDGLSSGGIRALIEAVDDSIVDALTVAGTTLECMDKLEEAVDCGITHPQALMQGEDPEPALKLMAELRKRVN